MQPLFKNPFLIPLMVVIFHSFKVKSFMTLILPFMLIVLQLKGKNDIIYFRLLCSTRQYPSLLISSLIFVDLGFVNESLRIKGSY